MTQVAVYNAGGGQLLHTVDLNHAIRMLVRRVARVREAVEDRTFGPFPLPRSLELVRWIYTKWVWEATGTPPVSRDNVLARDNYICGYCGRTGTTWDHIVPKCQGGTSTWLNTVAACESCNGKKKGGRTPEQAGMRLQVTPFVPTMAQLLPKRRR